MLYFPQTLIEEINNVNPQLILDYFGLQYRYTGKYYLLPCPIHNGKDKNFKVNAETKKWACFSHNCLKNSSNIDFIMTYQNVSFQEAVKIIASIAGIPIKNVTEMEAKKLKIKNKIKRNYYREKNTLNITNKKEDKKSYSFVIPENNGVNHPMIQQKNIPKDILDKFGVYYNKKMNRIVFLIKNEKGEIVSYKARATTKQQEKYRKFDSPSGYVLDTLYGLWVTAPYIKEKKEIILVEGQWDVIKLFKCGIKNVAGTMLNTIIEAQAKWIVDNGILKVKIARDKDNISSLIDIENNKRIENPGDNLVLKAYELLGDYCEIEEIEYPSYCFKIKENNKNIYACSVFETKLSTRKNNLDIFKITAIPYNSETKIRYEIYTKIKDKKLNIIDAYKILNSEKINIKNNVLDYRKYKDPDSLPDIFVKKFFNKK